MEEFLQDAASLLLLVLHGAALYLVWRGLRAILKPEGSGTGPVPEPVTLPREVEEPLSQVDWSTREVLVGSVRTAEQLRFNLEACCYYVPARYLTDRQPPVRFIALHEEGPGQNPGIRWFGEVASVQTVPRGTIPVAMRPKADPEEPYCFFRLKPWQALPQAIALQGTPRGKPRFTNRFLLEHCSSSWQLFAVSSEEDYRLLIAVDKAFSRASSALPGEAALYQAGSSHRLLAEKGWVTVQNSRGHILDRIPLSSHTQSPRAVFLRIRKAIR